MATARLAALLPGAASWLTSLQPEDGHQLLSQEQTALMAELVALLVPRLQSQGGSHTVHTLHPGAYVYSGQQSQTGTSMSADIVEWCSTQA